MRRNVFNEYIENRQFLEMFIMEMGWNNVKGQQALPPFIIDDTTLQIYAIAERNGFHILKCEVEKIPTSSQCKKLDLKLRRAANDYILIFYEPEGLHHLWMAPVKKTEKRDLVFIEYETLSQADFLFSKIDSLSFDLDADTTIMDVKERIQGAFIVNSEKLTKDFYAGFRKQHTAFVKFISGIDDEIDAKHNRNKEWYASIMLNRLMFCYFIQKKGFLDNNTNYLRDKLRWVQQEQGEDRFFSSFYRGFLTQLFHDGLNDPRHTPEFERTYGRIPYLNGGMFDVHQLEQAYEGIDIQDEAFENLFAFFDQWHWHLDDRHTATGKHINPDVLGYIFEKYINDRAAMGAYYTKEDITEYIGKNCILPFLMDKVKGATQDSEKYFRPNGYVWQTLAQSGDAYIYDAVKKGYTEDWQERIPDYIAEGIDTTKPNLLERRSRWNERTSEEFALPTEIWRETVERLQRCDHLLEKIYSGKITEINDFITYNLDIRQFVYDLLLNADDHHYVAHFYHALQEVTILDPTCGSGAFLFAAMNILEPLYEICIERMEDWHSENPNLFKDELEEIDRKYRSNRQYFIYKSIILRNLYGVDIMVEATEIAKLRLFLKMVAVVDVDSRSENLGLDPLPDIDFNIRCGNTLVGYATEEELERDLQYGDMFANAEFRDKVEEGMDKAARAFNIFKQVQFRQEENMSAFKEAKNQLRARLATLDETLNQRLFASSGDGNPIHYDAWRTSHQPFHWLAEFYEIIHGNGGFDVIIGNPPYLEMRQIDYKISNYITIESGAVHAFCIERSLMLSNSKGNISMIVPIALVCTQRMVTIQKLLEQKRTTWYSNYAWRPAKLFDAVNRALSIFIANANMIPCHYTTPYKKWISDNRKQLFHCITYTQFDEIRKSFWMPKLQCELEKNILDKLQRQSFTISNYIANKSSSKIYYRTTGGLYWKVFTNFSPSFLCNGIEGHSSRETSLSLRDSSLTSSAVAFFSSNLFWWWYTITSNLRDLNPSDLYGIKIPENLLESIDLQEVGEEYITDLKANSVMLTREQKNKGTTQTQSFKISMSKSIIDKIDKVLAKHYGFTEEELDFIINYDIKYRMGDELNEE